MNTKSILHLLLATLLAATLLVPAAAADRIRVVATFSILGDMVQRVGADRIELSVLVPHDADAHGFKPAPRDARTVTGAAIVFANGRGFDSWAGRLVRATGGKARLVNVAAGVAARPRDPHAWQNVENALVYVDAIEAALVAADPAGASAYSKAAAAYRTELRALHEEIRASLAAIPKDRRRVITTHDAFGFFGEAYGIRFMAPLGMSTHAQASAKSLATLVRQIRKERISALFLENVTDERMIRQVARETGTSLGGALYSDALSAPAGPAGTYVAMMRHNTRLLTEAMAEGS
jgi:zinc/manganese transport system substrate-binding protein